MNYMDVEQMIEDRRRGNFGYWLKWRKTWTHREAAFLLLAKCPLDFHDDPTPDPVENLLQIMESDPALPERVSPLAAAQWFQRTFGEVVELPPELITLLEEAKTPTEPPDDVVRSIAAWEVEDVQPPDSTDRELRYAPELSGVPEAQEPTPATDRAQAGRIMRNSQPSQVAKDAKYRSLMAAATELWANGDRRRHHEMRDFLLSDPQYSGLPNGRVLDKLKDLLKGKLNKPELIYNKATKLC